MLSALATSDDRDISISGQGVCHTQMSYIGVIDAKYIVVMGKLWWWEHGGVSHINSSGVLDVLDVADVADYESIAIAF